MNETELKRFQAGRCDAHGNRMIAFDRCYLRGYFAALMSGLNGVNPFNIPMDNPFYPTELMNLRRYALHIDRQVDEYLEDLPVGIAYLKQLNVEAFERGKTCI